MKISWPRSILIGGTLIATAGLAISTYTSFVSFFERKSEYDRRKEQLQRELAEIEKSITQRTDLLKAGTADQIREVFEDHGDKIKFGLATTLALTAISTTLYWMLRKKNN